ncbi:hypothetical protein VNI00_012355 [Paramarasmius palmivorus]|uniref:Uncharacterized protein n=1 Tax=Paramarasmius palmivorus TaxID=297713 RepID=A0AAW0C730_9AGAR
MLRSKSTSALIPVGSKQPRPSKTFFNFDPKLAASLDKYSFKPAKTMAMQEVSPFTRVEDLTPPTIVLSPPPITIYEQAAQTLVEQFERDNYQWRILFDPVTDAVPIGSKRKRYHDESEQERRRAPRRKVLGWTPGDEEPEQPKQYNSAPRRRIQGWTPCH